MPEVDVSPQFAQLLRDKVSEGDLAWVRDHFQSGRLNFLRDHITTEDRGQFASRLAKGDMPWIRQILASVDVPGVGPLSLAAPAPPAMPLPSTPLPTMPLPTMPLAPLLPDTSSLTGDMAPPSGYAPPTGDVSRIDIAPPLVQSLGAPTPTASIAEGAGINATAPIPMVPTSSLSSSPSPSLLDEMQDTPVSESADTVVPRKKPWLPILLALLIVGGGLYWLINRNSSSSTTETTVKAAGTTVAVASGGATTAPGATTAAVATTPAASVAPTVASAAAAPLLETLQAEGNHKTLLTALQASGLNDTLKNGGPYTIFAPTDTAFAQLPPGTLDKLLANKDALTKVLLFHVASGNLGPTALKSGPLASLEGSPLSIKVEGTNVVVNDAAATADPKAGNVYSIDKVLLPPDAIPAGGETPTATTVAPATVAPTPSIVPVTASVPKAGSVSVFFNAASSNLTQEATVALTDVAKKIRAAGPKTVVKITGYADNRGSADQIALVSRERAQRVADYLVSLGAQADYKVIGGGAIPGTDYDQARRVDIELP